MKKQNSTAFVIAHRGASGSAPENTLSAIQKAAELGCQWIEVDATTTADSQAVLHHDDDIDRCSDGEGMLLNKSLATLQQQDFGQWLDPCFRGERIPTLASCATMCKDLGISCNVEIKAVNGWEESTAEVVCNTIRNSWPTQSPLLLSSFHASALLVAKSLLPDIPRSYLTTVIPRDWEQKLTATGCTALHCSNTPLLSKQAVQEVTSMGYALRIYTVDDPVRAAELHDWGVESIFSNHPERMAAIGLRRASRSPEHVE